MRSLVGSQLEPTGAPVASFAPAASQASIELYWIPVGAGGWFVKLNGRIWEAMHALWQRRRPLDLYHTALVVRVPEGRFVIENCWPIPNAEGPSRGVLVEGPVFSRRLGCRRVFRYEVRCWSDGIIADANEAVASPQVLSDDPVLARRLLELVDSVPSPVWGRDELGTGEMWNSNSVIAWLLARSGLPTEAIQPPAGGRAPGWQAGLAMAHRFPPGASGPRPSWKDRPSGPGLEWVASTFSVASLLAEAKASTRRISELVVERHGGTITIDSRPAVTTRVGRTFQLAGYPRTVNDRVISALELSPA